MKQSGKWSCLAKLHQTVKVSGHVTSPTSAESVGRLKDLPAEEKVVTRPSEPDNIAVMQLKAKCRVFFIFGCASVNKVVLSGQ